MLEWKKLIFPKVILSVTLQTGGRGLMGNWREAKVQAST